MLFVLWIPMVLQVVFVLALLVWLAYGRPTSRTELLLRAVLVAAYLVAIGAGGLWLVVPWYTPLLYGGLYLLAVRRSVRRWERTVAFPTGPVAWASTVISGALLVLTLGLATYIFTGWSTPVGAVDLSFPLRNGTYLVVNGGGNELINAHNKTLEDERFRAWRGQSHGVDIEKLNGLGLRARGILPRKLTAYEIFGEPVFSPCAGEVIAANDGVSEMTPPEMDRQNMAGNYVILACSEVWVVLGHLRNGSVAVRTRQRVSEGASLGQVGNTGNTGEPHLHIHAQRPGAVKEPLSGHPLPVRFGGRYPVRNARFTERRNEVRTDSQTSGRGVTSGLPTGDSW
jgi:hypothetical protein